MRTIKIKKNRLCHNKTSKIHNFGNFNVLVTSSKVNHPKQ